MKKAQAAMEYLMTYGWAIIIVIIVAAALYAMGLFSPGATSIATRFNNIGPPEIGAWQLLSDGSFLVKLSNGAPYAINISSLTVSTGIDCTSVQLNGAAVTGAGVWLGIGTNFNITATCGTPSAGSVYGIDIDMSGLNDKGMSFAESGRVTGTVV